MTATVYQIRDYQSKRRAAEARLADEHKPARSPSAVGAGIDGMWTEPAKEPAK